MLNRVQACAVAGVLAAFVQMEAVAETNLYRYRNAEGNVVVDYTVPPEFAGKGYDILSSQGRLLETVEPQLEDEGLASSPEIQAAREREDGYILRSYRSVREIEIAGQRKLDMIHREIEILESNIESARNRRGAEQERAANYERSGRPVPDSILRVLRELEIQLQQADGLLAKRRSEYEETEKRYDWYARRFQILTETSEKIPGSSVETGQPNRLSVRD